MKELIKRLNEINQELAVMAWVLEGNVCLSEDETVWQHISSYKSELDELNKIFEELREKHGSKLIKDLAE